MKKPVFNALMAAMTLSYGMLADADGLIVPLYIDPNDEASVGEYTDTETGDLNEGTLYSGVEIWDIAADEAKTLKNGSVRKYKDYWVIANGPNSGPYPLPLNKVVKTAFDKVRKNNGKIFGYVHTADAKNPNKFIKLSFVQQDVAKWVKSYPLLDGIFIDEFWPVHEVDGSNPTYRPTNVKPMLNGQINPVGGYYDQLTKWIKKTYPKLKIITNPGGRVESNQYLWNNLGSVVCSFENTLSYALDTDEAGFSNMLRETKFTKVPQCALIHSNTTSLEDAIDQAVNTGYKYFYTVEASADDNTWGIMPSYFSDEVSYIATGASTPELP